MKRYKCQLCHKMIKSAHSTKSHTICGKCTRLMRKKRQE